MLELIFVIVIIGVLAAIALPKLSENKDNASAVVCSYEIGQYISEVSQAYSAAKNFAIWSSSTNYIDVNITNISVGTTIGNGIQNASKSKIDGTKVVYICSGEKIATMVAEKELSSGIYNLTITIELVTNVVSPTAKKAIVTLVKLYAGQVKVFKL